MSFWDTLPKPFVALAPMEDVTDNVFRQIIAGVGKPDVFFTEFSHVEAILHGEVTRLKYTEVQRPIVAQIWGTEPEKFRQAAEVIAQMGFDGIDLNFGCPVHDVIKQGACGGLICEASDKVTRDKVTQIIAATKEAGLPVSVKTRIGKKTIITEDWIGFLLEQGLAAITVHGRTVAEQSKVPAHWDEIGKTVSLKHVARSSSLIVGNGDIESLDQARAMVQKYGVDGVMIGRGIFHNPWLFADREGTREEKIQLLKQHLQLWEQEYGTKNFQVMKKFVKMYIAGWEGAAELRAKIMASRDLGELRSIIGP